MSKLSCSQSPPPFNNPQTKIDDLIKKKLGKTQKKTLKASI